MSFIPTIVISLVMRFTSCWCSAFAVWVLLHTKIRMKKMCWTNSKIWTQGILSMRIAIYHHAETLMVFCFSFYILYRWDLNIGLLFNNKRLYHFFLVEPTKFLENLRISLVFENIGFCKWYEKSLSPHREEEWWVLSCWEHHTLETIESDFVWYV